MYVVQNADQLNVNKGELYGRVRIVLLFDKGRDECESEQNL